MSRRFVIPDIHGCARTFRSLLHDVLRLRKGDVVYLLGDLIDRGPDTKRVLDEVLRLRRDGFSIEVLRGNHEQMLLDSCLEPSSVHLWLFNGGDETLRSFGTKDPLEIPRHYLDFLKTLPYYVSLERFVLVHAGLNFRTDNPFADTDSMLWNRSGDIDRTRIGGRRLISGHTPCTMDEIRKSLIADRIMLDNGCVYAGRRGLGRLTALELETMRLYSQDNIDITGKGENL